MRGERIMKKYNCETCMDLKNKYMKIGMKKRVSGCPDCGDYSITMEREL